ncbi:retrotransposon protein, putative, ty1-copia subclass [Tanacetum coccineum]
MKFVEQPIRPTPDPALPDTIDKYYEFVNLEQEVTCLMLSSMSPDLQRTLEKYNAFDMMKELKTMFEEQAKQELFETVKAFYARKQEDGQLVSSYLLKMKSYLDTLERLGYAMPKELGIPKKAENSHSVKYTERYHPKGTRRNPQGAKGRSARIPQAPDRYGYYVDVEEYELGDLDEPPNYKAELADPKYDKWLEAKTDMDGNVHTFKARLVAKGYTQTYKVDYGETFSPVADIRAIRILLAIAAFYDYEIWQMDVKTAFLNGHLSEDVYMVQPEGFVDPKHPNKVCKLQRSIYGLKQASRS